MARPCWPCHSFCIYPFFLFLVLSSALEVQEGLLVCPEYSPSLSGQLTAGFCIPGNRFRVCCPSFWFSLFTNVSMFFLKRGSHCLQRHLSNPLQPLRDLYSSYTAWLVVFNFTCSELTCLCIAFHACKSHCILGHFWSACSGFHMPLISNT